ncbi:MAG: DnaB-like helicase C-terminal domain-containing protein, partial [Cetobacterium sp.]
MIKIIKTVCNCKTDEGSAYISVLKDMLSFNSMYQDSKNVDSLTDFEVRLISFVTDCYEKLGDIPTCEIISNHMGINNDVLENMPKFEDLRSLKLYSKGILKSKLVDAVNSEIANMGALGQTQTAEDKDRLRELTMIEDSEDRVYTPRFNFMSYYQDRLQRPAGMKFPSKFLNDKAGEMAEGEMTTIAGYTSQFKSTLLTNIVYHNVLNYGFNGVVFSLETTKDHFHINLLSRHSIGNAGEFQCIPAKKVKRVLLTEKEIIAFEGVNNDWDNKRLGNLFVIDESDMRTKDPSEFMQILEEIDDLLEGNLHFFCVDYIQLLKNTDYSSNKSDSQAVGAYMEIFRQATQSFRKGTKHEKKLIGVMLSQITRNGVDYANSNEGAYPGPNVLSDSS